MVLLFLHLVLELNELIESIFRFVDFPHMKTNIFIKCIYHAYF